MHDGDRDADQQVSRVRMPVPCRATNESPQEINEINLINKFASRLDPISLFALLASILILQISLIFFHSAHF